MKGVGIYFLYKTHVHQHGRVMCGGAPATAADTTHSTSIRAMH